MDGRVRQQFAIGSTHHVNKGYPMNSHDLVLALGRLPTETDFLIVIAQGAVNRSVATPMESIRSLSGLISTLSTTLSAHQRIGIAEDLRDLADQLEQLVITT
jgi:hypothetical protein